MCGFVGYIHHGNYRPAEAIRSMAAAIAHRGPDGQGYLVDEGAALGFRRLALVDLAGGDQPLLNEDQTLALCFNGEIYNHRILRKSLEASGHRFSTETDSEVILHGFEEWGEDLLPKLRGMFAFVIWDRRRKRLFGARDPFGIKPFYYQPLSAAQSGSLATDGGLGFATTSAKRPCTGLLFASEIKGLLAHPACESAPNINRLPHYFSFEYLPDDETLFRNVLKLPAGHWLRWEQGTLTVKRWKSLRFEPNAHCDAREAVARIQAALDDSVAAHSLADVEVGSFLSGGVDSSLVAWKASRTMRLQTFTVGFDEPGCSEIDDARAFAKAAGLTHHAKTIDAAAFFDAMPAIVRAMDEPLPNPSAVPLWFLAHFAAESVKAVLSGEGADELFGGYPTYRECLAYHRWMAVPQPLRGAIGSAAAALPPFHGRRFLMRGRHPLPERYLRAGYVFSAEELPSLLAGGADPSIGLPSPSALVAPCFAADGALDEVAATQQADLQTWLAQDILLKADKMSMAASLELRVPFLDPEVALAAMPLPLSLRLAHGQTKVALRQAAQQELPAITAQRPKKGFVTPLARWLKEDPWHGRVRETLCSTTARRLFNTETALKLLDDHRSGRAANMRRIWSLYCLVLWHDAFFH